MNLLTPQSIAAMYTPKGIKPPQWFHQMYGDAFPEMTAAPELWRGLRVMVPLWEGAGPAIALVDGSIQTFSVESGSPSWGLEKSGRVRSYDGTSHDRGGVSGDTVDGADAVTVMVFYVPNLVDAADEGIWGTWDSVTGTPNIHLVSSSASIRNRRPRFFLDNGTTQLIADGSDDELALGEEIVFIGTWSSKDDGKSRAYINGSLSATSTGTITSSLPTGFDVWTIASYFDDGSRRIDGDFYICAQWDRKLSASEISFISNDPFAMLRPALV